MAAPLGRVVIYTKKIDEMAAFYCQHFGFETRCLEGDRIVELRPKDGGVALLLHPAATGQKEGQSLVKLVFDVRDVAGFCAQAKERGLIFGALHQGDGYVFANAKDPAGKCGVGVKPGFCDLTLRGVGLHRAGQNVRHGLRRSAGGDAFRRCLLGWRQGGIVAMVSQNL